MNTKEQHYEGVLEGRRIAADPELTKCPCPEAGCEWRGRCKECVAIHRAQADHIPVCLQHIIQDKLQALAGTVQMTATKNEETPLEHWQYVKERDQAEGRG